MKLIKADFILTCEDNMRIISNGAMVFDKKIIDVGESFKMVEKYPQALVIDTPKNSLLMPGLINTHVHLEYSGNKGVLKFGEFVPWLESIIKHRQELQENLLQDVIKQVIEDMIKSGTTTFGAISSFGIDIEQCAASKATVVLFNEALGTRSDAIDVLFGDFKQRLAMSEEYASERFIPAISIHSPYSTHPILAKHVLKIAKTKNCLISTHFMESMAEREWCDGGIGDFKRFLEQFTKDPKPFYKPMDFLKMFKGFKTLFTHGVCLNEDELKFMSSMDATITHCGVSNRLLGSCSLDLERVEDTGINLALGTDGLSSNISLNMWDELRNTLFIHSDLESNFLAKMLIKASTNGGAKAFNLPKGKLKAGKDADFLVIDASTPNKDSIYLQLILNTKQPTSVFIAGEEV